MGSSSDLKDLLRERVATKYTIDDLKETGKKIRPSLQFKCNTLTTRP